MVDLKPWLAANELTVRDFALGVHVALKTAQDWVYRGVVPSVGNQRKVAKYVRAHCAHHWVIAAPDGPMSKGVCQHCGRVRQFQNSSPEIRWPATKPRGGIDKAVRGSWRPRTDFPQSIRTKPISSKWGVS